MKLHLLAVLVPGLALLPMALHGQDVMPMGELDQVTVKTIPSYVAIEAEITGSVEKSWEKGYRQDVRYATEVRSKPSLPVVVIYPEWENKTPVTPTRMLVQLILDPQGNTEKLPETQTVGLKVTEIPATTVVGYAYRGAYTLENFQKALAHVDEYVKRKDLKPIGPPRHLYFSNTAWTPAFMRVSEVQIPIVGETREKP